MGEYRSQIKPLYGTPLSKTHWSNQGLAGNWTMNEGSGLVVRDDSGNDNHGAMIGMSPMSPTSGWVPGPQGPALAFPGANSYVFHPTFLDIFPTEFSAVVHVQETVGGPVLSKTNIVAKDRIYLYCKAEVGFETESMDGGYASLTSNKAVNDGLPHQLVFTWGISGKKIYIDGAFDIGVVTQITTLRPGTAADFKIGTTEYADFFTGLISSVSTYNLALSAEEIAYKNTFPWCGYEDEKGMQDWLFNQNATAMQQIYRYYSIGAGR